MSETPGIAPVRSLGAAVTGCVRLAREVLVSGFGELWAHKLRTSLTLALLALGVFTLVVMTSVLGGVEDKIRTGFKGMSWDGTLQLQPRSPGSTREQKRFAMSLGLNQTDLARLTAPDSRVAAFLPRASREVTATLGGEPCMVHVSGVVPAYFQIMNRAIASGRCLSPVDAQRRGTVAVLGATLAARLLGGADPVGRDIVLEGRSFQVIGVLAPQVIFDEGTYLDAHGILVPLEAFKDRLEPTGTLDSLTLKLARTRDLADVAAMMLARSRQAHHGIDDVEISNLDAQALRAYQGAMREIQRWRTVLCCLAGTVLTVGGIGVLAVMLISFSERRYEIGLRKALGATDREILGQFLLEAGVLGTLGSLAGIIAASFLCKAISHLFPHGLAIDPRTLGASWLGALALAMAFGLYPAIRAMRLEPIAAMR